MFVAMIACALGCKHPHDCDTAIGNAIEVGRAGNNALGGGDKPAKLGAAMLAHCKADHWGDDVLACYGNGKDNQSLSVCIDKLTADQQDKLMTDLAPMLSEPRGSGSGTAR